MKRLDDLLADELLRLSKRCSRDELVDLLVHLALEAFAAGGKLDVPPQTAAALAAFSRRIGVPANAPPSETYARAIAYFEAHPISDELRTAARSIIQRVSSEATRRERAARALIGDRSCDHARLAAVRHSDQRPELAVRSPMARRL